MVLYPNKLPESERVCSGICKDNERIVQLEGYLIHSILPPFNDDIPYKIEIKTPQKAF